MIKISFSEISEENAEETIRHALRDIGCEMSEELEFIEGREAFEETEAAVSKQLMGYIKAAKNLLKVSVFNVGNIISDMSLAANEGTVITDEQIEKLEGANRFVKAVSEAYVPLSDLWCGYFDAQFKKGIEDEEQNAPVMVEQQ